MSGRGLPKAKSCLDGKLANLISETTFAVDKPPPKKKCWTNTCERNASPCPWPTQDPWACHGPVKRGWPQPGSASQAVLSPPKCRAWQAVGMRDAVTRCLDDRRARGPFAVSRCHSHCCQWELDGAPGEQQALGMPCRMRSCWLAGPAPALPPSFGEALQNKRLQLCSFRGTTTGPGWWAPRHFFLHLQDATGPDFLFWSREIQPEDVPLTRGRTVCSPAASTQLSGLQRNLPKIQCKFLTVRRKKNVHIVRV